MRSLVEDTAALRSGSDVTAYLSDICARIERLDDRIRAFVPESGRRDRVLTAGRHASPPWQGIPVAVKDIIHVDGLPTRAGSELPPDVLTGPQATIVSRLISSGAVVVGKTVTAEFAMAAPGPTANPRRFAHTPGGSSSGSAAAVAAGFAPLALGTQTLGSVIRPAAYCGVVGFTPTHGRVPLDGVLPNAPTLDKIGWFVATVADAELAATAIATKWSRTTPTEPATFAIPSESYLGKASSRAREAFTQQVECLRKAGLRIRGGDFAADFDEYASCAYVIQRWEFVRTHERWFRRYGECYRPETRTIVEQGQAVSESEYRQALVRREQLITRYDDSDVDCWIAPAATDTAPHGLDSTGDSVMNFPFSLVGAPAVSIPAGRDADGLPWGLQCAGRRGGDEQLLAHAAAIERTGPGDRTGCGG